MHRALELLEIVETICDQVGGQPILSGGRKDLATLARTCTSFLNPALNVLWRDQQTICNLLRCMPDDLWDIAEYGTVYQFDHHIDISLRRIITSTDWERPLFYLNRVRTLRVEASFESSDFFEALSLSLPGDYLFPNLQELTWSPESYDGLGSAFHHVRLFLAPYIHTLSLDGIETITDISILSHLARRHPSLKHVIIPYNFPSTIDPPSPWDKATPLISSFVKDLPCLVSLDVPSLDDVALAHLAQLPSLNTLTIGSHHPVASSFQPPAESIPFPALTRLTLPTMVAAISLITRLSGCSLEKFTIPCNKIWPTTDVARQFYSTLATHCSHSYWQPATLNADQPHIYSIDGGVIEPLFSFSNLVSVSLSHPLGFDFDDTTILRLARTWPHIKYLTLKGRPRHMPSRVTLEGLCAFAKHCPNLETLEMTFDATVKVAATLSVLSVALSPIRKPRRVAKFLSAIFPRLTDIETLYEEILDDRTDDEDDDEDVVVEAEVIASYRRWKVVEEALSEF
ncbi:hypothetical protein B0H13DRAFT_1964083 [Mycena leptocephala]|nr:hypothetical protein B0H13DRAFT_1964083 [Mycena leptocephala]